MGLVCTGASTQGTEICSLYVESSYNLEIDLQITEKRLGLFKR